VVNGNHPKNRRRFTMAHEISHAILHWKWLNKEGQKLDKHLGEILYRSNSHNYINTKRERQANMFAAEQLAQLDDVKENLDRNNLNNNINLKRKRQANKLAADLLASLDKVKEMLDRDKHKDLNMAKKIELENSVS